MVSALVPTPSIDSTNFELVTVASGARSLRSIEHDETFHPVVGPMAEARGLHVGQQQLLERARQVATGPLVIWDVGLGAAANALAAMEAFRDASAISHPHGLEARATWQGLPPNVVELHSFDRTIAPLEFALKHAGELGYLAGWEETLATLLRQRSVQAHGVHWHLHVSDFREVVSDRSIPSPHAVMFDPYGPTSNPELWNLETFGAIRQRADHTEGCTLTSYSRSTAVRVTLLLAGWFVGRGKATGEKDETTVAATRLELLARPLEPAWLDRVRRSTAPGPITRTRPVRSAPEIATQLMRHPQFA
jgi:tRNA U34 5-methylaminomethyl-2-thiouridine-forming methyltransferase MnmC